MKMQFKHRDLMLMPVIGDSGLIFSNDLGENRTNDTIQIFRTPSYFIVKRWIPEHETWHVAQKEMIVLTDTLTINLYGKDGK
jgi:hypothetical protein